MGDLKTIKDTSSLQSLEARLNNINARLETLRDNLRGCIELHPVSQTEKERASTSPTIKSLDNVSLNIQGLITQCEELYGQIMSG